jgi:hypothetical protein
VADTPFAETEALLALLRDDEPAAVGIVDDMLPGERRAFGAVLGRLAMLVDGRQRCPRCGGWAADEDAVMQRLPDRRWHRACHLADLEQRAARGDRRARAILELTRRARSAARRMGDET